MEKFIPIPNHLQDILTPYGDYNSKTEVTGYIVCTCGSSTFSVSIFGDIYDDHHGHIRACKYNDNYALMIIGKCDRCNREHLIFDYSQQGWKGFICHEGVTAPIDIIAPFVCEKCNSNKLEISVGIEYEGKEWFIGKIADKFDFSEDAWIDAFEELAIWLNCSCCRRNHYFIIESYSDI